MGRRRADGMGARSTKKRSSFIFEDGIRPGSTTRKKNPRCLRPFADSSSLSLSLPLVFQTTRNERRWAATAVASSFFPKKESRLFPDVDDHPTLLTVPPNVCVGWRYTKKKLELMQRMPR